MSKLLKTLDKNYQLLINGQWTDGTKGKKISSYNPSNGE